MIWTTRPVLASTSISVADDTIRRYLHDLEGLDAVQLVGKRPMRWSFRHLVTAGRGR